VLDVGCGTGTLAILAKKRGAGTVAAVDASPEMIARAKKKAARAGVEVDFQLAPAQALPFPDARFDLALSTLMLHHLGREARDGALREVRRVLKTGGRVLVVDFGSPGSRHGPLAHLHRRHGAVPAPEVARHLEAAGLRLITSGPVGFRDLHFSLAAAA
jgi:ubiquinone/menaquinone biosynthesis C-methylase UbiE